MTFKSKLSGLEVTRFVDLTKEQQDNVLNSFTFCFLDAQHDYFYGVDINGHVYQRYLKHQVVSCE